MTGHDVKVLRSLKIWFHNCLWYCKPDCIICLSFETLLQLTNANRSYSFFSKVSKIDILSFLMNNWSLDWAGLSVVSTDWGLFATCWNVTWLSFVNVKIIDVWGKQIQNNKIDQKCYKAVSRNFLIGESVALPCCDNKVLFAKIWQINTPHLFSALDHRLHKME